MIRTFQSVDQDGRDSTLRNDFAKSPLSSEWTRITTHDHIARYVFLDSGYDSIARCGELHCHATRGIHPSRLCLVPARVRGVLNDRGLGNYVGRLLRLALLGVQRCHPFATRRRRHD